MHDKIVLLMEETGCDRGEAELALEMCGFQVEEAIKAIARLLRNIVVVKGRFALGEQFGQFLLIANVKTGGLLRSRAVLSFNPAVYAASLEKDWFEFEKHLFGCRLWDGSVQNESLEIEQRLSSHFRQAGACERLANAEPAALEEEVAGILTSLLKAPVRKLQLKREILDLRQFHSLRSDSTDRAGKTRASAKPQDELLVLKVALEEDADGLPAAELRAGDFVGAQITDSRDIAQYLSKLFGGYSEKGPLPVLAPIEALESGPSGLLARVRFSVGVCGDAAIEPDRKVRVVRYSSGRPEAAPSWWKRLFKS